MSDSVVTFATPQLLGRYRVERALGAGGHSQVFLAWDEGDHGFRKQVALKVLPLQSKPGAPESLRREARLLAALNHPNVVDVYGIGESNGLHFIVMEYVIGSTLAEIRDTLEHHGLRFPRSVVCDVGIAISEALYCAWNATDANGTRLNIVHRDLKPANVLLSRQGVPKVGDFGIAKAASDVVQTQGRRVKGTPSYMPPELMRGSRDFAPSMDLWSLGIMLWEMCTGHRFYGRVALHELLRKLDSRTPDEEAAAVAGYFPELSSVLVKLLARDPADRFQDPMEVAQELRKIRADLGPSPSLVEFARLVRGSTDDSVEPGEVLEMSDPPPDWAPLFEFGGAAADVSDAKPIRLVADIHEALALPPSLRADHATAIAKESPPPEPEVDDTRTRTAARRARLGDMRDFGLPPGTTSLRSTEVISARTKALKRRRPGDDLRGMWLYLLMALGVGSVLGAVMLALVS